MPTILNESDFDPPKIFNESDFDKPQSGVSKLMAMVGGDYSSITNNPLVQNFGRGMALMPSTDKSYSNTIANSLGNSLPSAVGATIGAGAGMGLASIPGAAAGGAAARSLQQAAYSALNPQRDTSSIVPDVLKTGAIQGAGQALGVGLSKLIPSALEYTATNLGGISKDSYQFAKEHLQDVLSHLQDNPQDTSAMAETLKSTVNQIDEGAKNYYNSTLDSIASNPDYANKTFNLFTRFRDKIFSVARDFQYDDPAIMGDSQDAKTFFNYVNKISDLRKANAQQVVGYNQMLTQLENKYSGQPLGAAFSQLKQKIGPATEQMIPEIGDANEVYKVGKTISDAMKPFTDVNDPVSAIKSAYSSVYDTNKRQLIDIARDISPDIDKSVQGIRASIAAQAFNPAMRSLPQTGMGAMLAKILPVGVGASGMELLHGNIPMALGGLAATGIGQALISPRFALAGLKAAQGTMSPILTTGLRTGIQNVVSNYWPNPASEKNTNAMYTVPIPK